MKFDIGDVVKIKSQENSPNMTVVDYGPKNSNEVGADRFYKCTFFSEFDDNFHLVQCHEKALKKVD